MGKEKTNIEKIKLTAVIIRVTISIQFKLSSMMIFWILDNLNFTEFSMKVENSLFYII